MTTKDKILTSTISILAREGYAGTSMRKVASAIDKEPSIIYAHFNDKESLLRAVRVHITELLDEQQAKLTATSSRVMMQQAVRFQVDNRELIVALLQYFMSMRHDFPLKEGGYVPHSAYEHMAKVLRQGMEEGRYDSDDPDFDAKLMTHLVNGFLMEYFDKKLTTKEVITLTTKLTQRLEKIVGGNQA